MEILDQYDEAEENITSILSFEIQSQNDSLRIENDTLKKQMQAKNAIIQQLESQINSNEIDDALLQEFNKIIDAFDLDQKTLDKLNYVIDSNDPILQIKTLCTFFINHIKHQNRVIARLGGIVKDNADFLISLIQSQTENKFKNMIVSRAEKTIDSIKGLTVSPTKFDTMKSILSNNVNFDERKKLIESASSKNNISKEELQALFIREVSITSSFAQKLMEERIANANRESEFSISDDTINRLTTIFGHKISNSPEKFENDLNIICSACEKYQQMYGTDLFSLINDMQAKIDSLQALDARNRAILAMQAAELAKYVS